MAGPLVEAAEAHLGVGLQAAVGEAPVQVRERLHLHFQGVKGLPGQYTCCAPYNQDRISSSTHLLFWNATANTHSNLERDKHPTPGLSSVAVHSNLSSRPPATKPPSPVQLTTKGPYCARHPAPALKEPTLGGRDRHVFNSQDHSTHRGGVCSEGSAMGSDGLGPESLLCCESLDT